MRVYGADCAQVRIRACPKLGLLLLLTLATFTSSIFILFKLLPKSANPNLRGHSPGVSEHSFRRQLSRKTETSPTPPNMEFNLLTLRLTPPKKTEGPPLRGQLPKSAWH